MPRLPLRRFVLLVAAIGALLRLLAIWSPLSRDEAGFLLVARAWDPAPDSVYGRYFVDRPPELIGLIKLTDAVGGTYGLRWLGGLLVIGLIVAAARVAWLLGEIAGADPQVCDRAARWSAVIACALSATTLFGSLFTKGESLGIPFVMAACALALEALHAHSTRAVALTFTAGLFASLSVGVKQNMLGGLVFGGVLLLGAALTHRITWTRFGGLAAAALLGAAVPVVVTVVWALSAGVHLGEVWYVAFGFRSDASAVLSGASRAAPNERARILVGVCFLSGMGLLVLWFLARIGQAWRLDRVLTGAVLAVLVMDTVGLVLGGSYWRPYLITPIPGVVLASALLLLLPGLSMQVTRWLAGFAALSCLVTLTTWAWLKIADGGPADISSAGSAIGRVAGTEDTIVVYGGHAEVVLASGLPSDYPYLWSLPMRTLDPQLTELRDELDGDTPPTWVVLAIPLKSWAAAEGPDVERTLERRYTYLGEVCGAPTYLLSGVERARPAC